MIAAQIIGFFRVDTAGGSSMALAADHQAHVFVGDLGRKNNILFDRILYMLAARSMTGFTVDADIDGEDVAQIFTLAGDEFLFGPVPGLGVKAGGVTGNTPLLPGIKFTVVIFIEIAVFRSHLNEEEFIAGAFLIPGKIDHG